jgi:hypothetical protein
MELNIGHQTIRSKQDDRGRHSHNDIVTLGQDEGTNSFLRIIAEFSTQVISFGSLVMLSITHKS